MAAQTVTCTACKRHFSESLADCPFCGLTFRAPAAPSRPVKCNACGRLRAAAMASCPFCATARDAGASAAAPITREDFEGAEAGVPLRTVIAAAAALLGPIAFAVWAKFHYAPIGSRLFYWCGLVSAPLGLWLLHALSREHAVDAVRAWGGPFYALRLRPAGEGLTRMITFLPWSLATLPPACALYGLLHLTNSIASGDPQKLSCQVESIRERPLHDVQITCSAPGEAVRGWVSYADLSGAFSGERRSVVARHGALGIWLLESSAPEEVHDEGLRRGRPRAR